MENKNNLKKYDISFYKIKKNKNWELQVINDKVQNSNKFPVQVQNLVQVSLQKNYPLILYQTNLI